MKNIAEYQEELKKALSNNNPALSLNDLIEKIEKDLKLGQDFLGKVLQITSSINAAFEQTIPVIKSDPVIFDESSKSSKIRNQIIISLAIPTTTVMLRDQFISMGLIANNSADLKILKNQIHLLFSKKEICKIGNKKRGGEWILARDAEEYRKKGKVTFSKD